ncbi:hypothetical protein IFM47457_09397, partial [Aspergillus lentulus]
MEPPGDTYITAYQVHSNNLGVCAATASTNLAQSALAAILRNDIVWVVWSSSGLAGRGQGRGLLRVDSLRITNFPSLQNRSIIFLC